MKNIEFNNLIDNSPVGIFYTDPDGDWSYVNRRWREITGLGADQANNKAWQTAVHPEDRQRCQQEWRAAVRAERPYKSKHRYVHDKDHVVWVSAQAFPEIDTEGRYRGHIGTLIDITENRDNKHARIQLAAQVAESTVELEKINAALKKQVREQKRLASALSESEARWRSFVENAPNIIAKLNRQGDIIFINRPLPCFREEMIAGMNIYDAVLQDHHQTLRDAMEKTFQTGEPTRIRVQGVGSDRANVWYACRIGHIQLKENNDAVIMILANVTEQVELRDQMEQHKRELSRLSQIRSLQELASSLAHELNQPLCAISNYTKGCLKRLRAGSLGQEELIAVQERIAAQAERAGDIMLRMRSLVNRGELKRVPIRINDLIHEAIAFMEPESFDDNITVDYQLSDQLPAFSVDKIQIEQVIINIVQNSIESIKTGENEKGCITITTMPCNENLICVSISDNGHGIPKDILEKLFDPFYTTKNDGMGIGLSICRSIIEAHGGHLTAENNSSGGAVFRFNLPIMEETRRGAT